MKRISTVLVAATCTLLCSAAAVHAVDTTWGVALDGSYLAPFDDASPEAGGAVTAWLRSRLVLDGDPVAPRSFVDLAVQGRYQYAGDEQILDLETLRLRGQWGDTGLGGAVLRTSAGRFRFRDRTGIVLDHPLDGGSVAASWQAVRVHLSGGYSGLQLNAVSRVRMSEADVVEQQAREQHLAPARIIGIAGVSFPEIMGRQTLDLEVIGQKDMRDAADDERIDTGYLTVALTGPVIPRVYYDLTATGMVDPRADHPAVKGMASLWAVFTGAVPLRITTTVGWASGRSDGTASFIPVSRDAVGSILALPMQNIALGRAALSVRPVQFLQVSADATAFFIGSARLPDIADVNPAAESGLIGMEYTGRIALRPTSDVGVGLSIASFFPATGTRGVFNEGVPHQGRLGVEVSLGL